MWQITPIIDDIRQNFHPIEDWRVIKIHQPQNLCAPSVAQWATTNFTLGCILLNSIPRCILHLDNGKDPP